MLFNILTYLLKVFNYKKLPCAFHMLYFTWRLKRKGIWVFYSFSVPLTNKKKGERKAN